MAKIVACFTVSYDPDGGLTLLIDESGGVYIREPFEMFAAGPPDSTLDEYKSGLLELDDRHPLAAVLNAVPLTELHASRVHLDRQGSYALIILPGQEPRRIDA
jgi:hypothetical protein